MSFLPKLLIGIKVSVMWVLKLFTILIALELLVVAGQEGIQNPYTKNESFVS